MSTIGCALQRELTRIKQQLEVNSDWPPEEVAMGILIATSVLSFLLVSSGLGSISWQLVKERDSQKSGESDPQYHLQDNGIHVQETVYTTSTGEY